MIRPAYTYLALGDSYTIGEAVPIAGSFPYQLVQKLRQAGYDFHAPEIIARTGWTTDELQAAISQTVFRESYDWVTLLIGVNNQYRGRSAGDYAPEFEALLQQAIRFAGNDPARVLVLSIPDWGVTPFAAGRNREQIARAIDEFNAAGQMIALQYGAAWVNITPGTREAAADHSLLTGDQLHPSEKEYARWVENIVSVIQTIL